MKQESSAKPTLTFMVLLRQANVNGETKEFGTDVELYKAEKPCETSKKARDSKQHRFRDNSVNGAIGISDKLPDAYRVRSSS